MIGQEIAMNKVTVKRTSTLEANVSQREIAYDIYVNGEYFTTRKDVCDAMDLKETLERQSPESLDAP